MPQGTWLIPVEQTQSPGCAKAPQRISSRANYAEQAEWRSRWDEGVGAAPSLPPERDRTREEGGWPSEESCTLPSAWALTARVRALPCS